MDQVSLNEPLESLASLSGRLEEERDFLRWIRTGVRCRSARVVWYFRGVGGGECAFSSDTTFGTPTRFKLVVTAFSAENGFAFSLEVDGTAGVTFVAMNYLEHWFARILTLSLRSSTMLFRGPVMLPVKLD